MILSSISVFYDNYNVTLYYIKLSFSSLCAPESCSCRAFFLVRSSRLSSSVSTSVPEASSSSLQSIKNKEIHLLKIMYCYSYIKSAKIQQRTMKCVLGILLILCCLVIFNLYFIFISSHIVFRY